MTYFVKFLLFFATSLVLLKLLGKRAFSQMAITEIVVMISLGTLLVHPLKSHNSWLATYGGFLLILGSLALSYIQLYFPRTMRWISGQPILLIQDGMIIKENLKRCRLPEADLHMRLRINKISNIKQIKTAVLEVSGYLAIELYSDYSHVTKKEFDELRKTINLIAKKLDVSTEFCTDSNPEQTSNQTVENLFLDLRRNQK